MNAISPELALVDPELAAVARAALYEPGQFLPASAAQAQPPARAKPASAARVVAPHPPAGNARPSRRRRLLVAGTASIAALLLLGFRWHQPEATTANVDVPQAVQHARALQDARNARKYAWPAVPGARAYTVLIRRGQSPIYTATTSSSTYTLPTAFHFAPGRYTWSATPIRGGHTDGLPTRPVVEVTFTVSG